MARSREHGFEKPTSLRYRALDLFQKIAFHERTAVGV